MSFGKRQVEKAPRELSQAADVMPRSESSLGTIVLICIAVAVVGAITYIAFSKDSVSANSAALATQSAGRAAGPVKIVDKVVTHDDNGRIGNEVIYYSNGTSESREYSYNASGKLERVKSRSSDGKLSITVHH